MDQEVVAYARASSFRRRSRRRFPVHWRKERGPRHAEGFAAVDPTWHPKKYRNKTFGTAEAQSFCRELTLQHITHQHSYRPIGISEACNTLALGGSGRFGGFRAEGAATPTAGRNRDPSRSCSSKLLCDQHVTSSSQICKPKPPGGYPKESRRTALANQTALV